MAELAMTNVALLAPALRIHHPVSERVSRYPWGATRYWTTPKHPHVVDQLKQKKISFPGQQFVVTAVCSTKDVENILPKFPLLSNFNNEYFNTHPDWIIVTFSWLRASAKREASFY